MASGSYRFDRFTLDPQDRQLRRDDVPVELNARYLDALTLLVRQQGKLVSKDRFNEEVWRGVPVTDEALTQCIKTLRRQLGDKAASPIFIETIAKHGYRFIAPVEFVENEPPSQTGGVPSAAANASPAFDRRELAMLGRAATLGGGVAGILGGLFYGFAAAQGSQPAMGAASALIVLVCVTILLTLAGAAGVGFGIAGAAWASDRVGPWSIAGGAAGGLIVGAVVKLIGLDAFNLLLGQSPGDITGAGEGALLGGAVGLGTWLAVGTPSSPSLRRGTFGAALAGGCGGLLIALLGGRMLGGSLDLLARQFPQSRLRVDQIGSLFGESGFGPVSQAVTSALECGVFGACIVAAILIVQQRPAI